MTIASPGTRTALLTGALGGIGRAIAHRLASDGYRLVLTDLQTCEALLESPTVRERVVFQDACDLASSDAVDSFANAALQVTSIDILVNNAALQDPVPFSELSALAFAQYLRINVQAPFQLSQRVVSGMIERRWGRIINLVSGSAWQPPRAFVGYISSKMALVGLTRSLAAELGDFGITVNGITPTLTRHPGNEDALPREMWSDGRVRTMPQLRSQAIRDVSITMEL